MLDRLEMRDGKVVAEKPLLVELKARIRDARVGPDGAVYVLTEANSLLKLIPRSFNDAARPRKRPPNPASRTT